MYGVSANVDVKEIEANKKIVASWGPEPVNENEKATGNTRLTTKKKTNKNTAFRNKTSNETRYRPTEQRED